MRGRIALLTAAAALLAVGCGGDDEGGSQPSKSAKRFHARAVEFHRRGEAVCRDAASDAARFARALLRGEAAPETMRRALAAESRIHRRFAKLDPPSPAAARYKRRAVALHRVTHGISRRIVTRLEAGVPLTQSFGPERRPLRRTSRKLDRLYSRLGLPECTSTEIEVLIRGKL